MFHIRMLIVMGVMSLAYFGSLYTTDYILNQLVKGYKILPPSHYSFLFFFVVTHTVNLIGVRYGWQKMQPYQIIGISVFLPAYFTVNVILFTFGMPEDIESYYAREICQEIRNDFRCGPAFAHSVLTRTIRALPLMFVMPVVYFTMLHLNFMGIKNYQLKDTQDA